MMAKAANTSEHLFCERSTDARRVARRGLVLSGSPFSFNKTKSFPFCACLSVSTELP